MSVRVVASAVLRCYGKISKFKGRGCWADIHDSIQECHFREFGGVERITLSRWECRINLILEALVLNRVAHQVIEQAAERRGGRI